MAQEVQRLLVQLRAAVADETRAAEAETLLGRLKLEILAFDSLPPLNVPTPDADAERCAARETFELAVVLSAKAKKKDEFQRYMSQLRPFYSDYPPPVSSSELKYTILGLNLLQALVDHRLADFHGELELLTEEEMQLPTIAFSVDLERQLMLGSYDQVLEAAAHPPHELFNAFLASLMESVR